MTRSAPSFWTRWSREFSVIDRDQWSWRLSNACIYRCLNFIFLFRSGWFVFRYIRTSITGPSYHSTPPRTNFYRHKVTRVIMSAITAVHRQWGSRKLIIRSTCNSLLQWPRYNEIFSPTFKPVVDLSMYIIRTYRLIYSRASLRVRYISFSNIYIYFGWNRGGMEPWYFSIISETNTRWQTLVGRIICNDQAQACFGVCFGDGAFLRLVGRRK